MKLQDQVCTAQQAAKLQELGITSPSLHQWWKMKYPASEESFAKNRANCLITPTGDNHDRFIMHYIDNENATFHWEEGTYNDGWDHSRCELEEGPVAAYTVAELGELLPAELLKGYHIYSLTLQKAADSKWGISYLAESETSMWPIDEYEIDLGPLAQVLATMLLHLLESKLITIEETNKRLQQ